MVRPDLITEITLGAFAAIGELVENFKKMISDVLSRFPNVFGMVDAVVKFSSSTFGITMAIPIQGLRITTLAYVDELGLTNRVFTVASGVNMAFDSVIKLIRIATFTDESSLTGAVATAAGSAVYRFIKRIKFLRAILGARSEAQFIQIVVESFQRKLNILKVVSFVSIVIIVPAALCAFVLSYSIPIYLAESDAVSRVGVFSQNSKRVWKSKSGQFRVNKRRLDD